MPRGDSGSSSLESRERVRSRDRGAARGARPIARSARWLRRAVVDLAPTTTRGSPRSRVFCSSSCARGFAGLAAGVAPARVIRAVRRGGRVDRRIKAWSARSRPDPIRADAEPARVTRSIRLLDGRAVGAWNRLRTGSALFRVARKPGVCAF